jgi:hypothetical protein
MKTIKQLFHYLTLLVMIITGSNLYAQQKSDFYQAKETLDSMLSGKTALSFEKAVFVTENAYWGNKIKYADFDNAINYNASKISLLAEVMHKYDTSKGRGIYPTDNKEQKIEGHNKLQKNWAIYTYMIDTTYFKHKDTITYHLPYLYSRNDPYATIDWRNSQVTGLLNTHTGNCYAMACLYKIFADKLNTGAVIATAPGHAFIQHTDDRGTVFNMELASRCFRGSGSIETFTYTTNKAVESCIAMRALTDRQDVSMCLVYLAKGFESTFNSDENGFILNCAELALSYDSLNLNAMLLKAEVLENSLINEQKPITQLQQDNTFIEYQDLVKHLYTLGYREMPIDMQNTILAKLKQDTYGTMANHEPQPFKTIKTNGQRTASLSSGLFDEEIKDKAVEKYHRTLFNTKTQTITAFARQENTYDNYTTDPVVAAMSVDPLTRKFPYYSPYQFAGDMPTKFIDLDGMEPNAYEAAHLAADVYNTENGHYKEGQSSQTIGGWELNTTLNVNIKLTDDKTGFNSAVYQRQRSDGTYEYAYVTQGTEPLNGENWKNNAQQALGMDAKEYDESVANARQISKAIHGDDKTLLTFVGHSLGGGMASANSLATGREAITFNAAGLSNGTKNRLHLNMSAKIDAFIIAGEIVNNTQSYLGLHAEGTTHYLTPVMPVDVTTLMFDLFVPKYMTITSHLMDNVLDIMDQPILNSEKNGQTIQQTFDANPLWFRKL